MFLVNGAHAQAPGYFMKTIIPWWQDDRTEKKVSSGDMSRISCLIL